MAGTTGTAGSGLYAEAAETLPVFTNGQIAHYLRQGFWEDVGRSAARFDVASGGVLTVDYSSLTPEGQALAAAALDTWSSVTGIGFVEVASDPQILFTDNGSGAGTAVSTLGGIIQNARINIGWTIPAGSGASLDNYYFQAYLHEIGHALGLGHAGNYNGGATYGTDNHYLNESWQSSLMSYFDQSENTYIQASYAFTITPMVADLIAIHDIYGEPAAIHADDTVYGENSTAGGVLDGLIAMTNPVTFTISDSDGIDTIDFRSETADQRIDLRPEAISDVLGLTGNMIIARNTHIENAVSGSGDDMIYGTPGDNVLNGGAGDDVIYGGPGNDILWGGVGADRLGGGMGDDVYYVEDAGDLVLEPADFGMDEVRSSVSFDLGAHGQHLEILRLTGGGDIDGTGNAQDNRIYGTAGDNVLNGGAGDDVIYAGPGNDILWGGAGADRMHGGQGDDIYYVEDAGDIVLEPADFGTDEVRSNVSFDLGAHSQHLEILRLTGGGDIDGTGNAQDNRLYGTAGDNVLNGGGGDDVIYGGPGRDILWGGAGADRMHGGQGDDIYYVEDAGDLVLEPADFGMDEARSKVSFNLNAHGQHLEILRLTGGGDIDGTGNSQDNLICGNAGQNRLDGGLGNDLLEGGAGADTFVFRSGCGADTILDFEDGADRIAVLSGASAFGDLDIAASGEDALVNFADVSIIFSGTDHSRLTADDFLFA